MLPGLSLQATEESRVEITDENLSHDVTSTLRCYQNESVDALLDPNLSDYRGDIVGFDMTFSF